VLQRLVQTSFGGEKSTWELVHNLKRKKFGLSEKKVKENRTNDQENLFTGRKV
jgi:hypothetical protein